MQSTIRAAGNSRIRRLFELQCCHEQAVVGCFGPVGMEVAAEVFDVAYFSPPEAGLRGKFFGDQDVVNSRDGGFRKKGAVFFAVRQAGLDIVAVVENIFRGGWRKGHVACNDLHGDGKGKVVEIAHDDDGGFFVFPQSGKQAADADCIG